MKQSYLAVLAIAAMLSAPLFADEPHKGACKKDVQTYCKDVQPGEGRIMNCLAENKDKVSAECKRNIGNFVNGFKQACGADEEKFCSKVERGQGRRLKCLNENSANLSPSCKAKLDEFKASHQAKHEERKAFMDACKADAKAQCKHVKPGQGRIISCLREKESSLSSACKAELAKTPAPVQ